jgi:hypothetical protein
MNSLLNRKENLEIAERLTKLTPDTLPKWGKMNASQMLEHCCVGLKVSLGQIVPKTNFFKQILGKILKKKIIYGGELRKNSPTSQEFVIPADIDFASGYQKLSDLIKIYQKEETKSKLDGVMHSFFGKLSSEEWGILMYKHLDHHLRQFGK